MWKVVTKKCKKICGFNDFMIEYKSNRKGLNSIEERALRKNYSRPCKSS